MKPESVFQLELAAAVAGRRALLMRLVFPVVLALPFIATPMPQRAKVAGLTGLVVFVAFFGAAVSFVHRRNDGLLERLHLLPIPPCLVAGDLLLAGALMDALQVFPACMLLLAVNAPAASLHAVPGAMALLFAVLLCLNLLGMLVGAAARSNAEVHLLSVLGAALIMLLSGRVPLSPRLVVAVSAAARVNPAAWFAGALEALLAGTPLPAWHAVVLPAALAVLLGVRRLARRVSVPRVSV